MRFAAGVLRELAGLFVDDGSLALQAIALIAVVGGLVKAAALAPNWGAGLLISGCLAILCASLWRATRR